MRSVKLIAWRKLSDVVNKKRKRGLIMLESARRVTIAGVPSLAPLSASVVAWMMFRPELAAVAGNHLVAVIGTSREPVVTDGAVVTVEAIVVALVSAIVASLRVVDGSEAAAAAAVLVIAPHLEARRVVLVTARRPDPAKMTASTALRDVTIARRQEEMAVGRYKQGECARGFFFIPVDM